MNVLSLFDGMSCGQIALHRAGIKYDKYYASEIQPAAIKVTQHNYPDTIQIGDVTKVSSKDLPVIDLLIGGSPCQGFSFAGKQLNFEDERSKLFFEYVRLLHELKPKYFLLENVKMAKEHELVINKILGVRPIRLNSDLVSAQKRKRLYWTNIPVNNVPKNKRIKLSEILVTDCADESLYLNEVQIKRGFKKHAAQTYKTGTKMGAVSFPTNTNKAKSLTKVNVIGSRETNHIKDSKGIRLLTVLEMERLQNVPEGYTSCVSVSKAREMLGNGWTVDIIVHIFSYIK